MIPRRAIATLFAAALLATGCSSSGSDGVRVRRTTTTRAPEQDLGGLAKYRDPGRHPVGTRTIALADGRRVVIWYPAAKSAQGQPKEIFDIASLLSPALQDQIPADLRPKYQIDAHPGAAAATDGPFPVVLFSHGYAGFPEQSADLTTHLASWGFVVVAPDHVERSLSGLLGTAGKGVPKLTDPVVLSQSLDAAIADAKIANSPLRGLLDTEKVAVVGHSAGASAAYEEASADPRIKAFIAYSIGLDGGPDGAKTKPPPIPKVPGMVLFGTADGIIEPSASRKVYAAMAAPKYQVAIANAGHLVFSDICLIGKDKGGLVALVKQAGLDLPANLLRLADDGCGPDALDPAKAFPAIDHLSVAFLRHELGLDPKPIGLDPSVTKSFTDAKVTLTADPG
ncbi:MAG: alpha/beta hydrolase family protein [Acidimicrobiales bacterium]